MAPRRCGFGLAPRGFACGLLVLGSLVVGACAPSAGPAVGAPAGASVAVGEPVAEGLGARPAEWQRVVQGAEQEGKVVVYGPARKPERDVATTLFNKAYPRIAVEYFAVGGSESGPRILAEQKAGVFNADVFVGGTTTPTQVLQPAGALEPVDEILLLPEVVDPSRWWQGQHFYVDRQGRYNLAFIGSVNHTVSYNTRLVKPEKLQSYWDLLDPRWRGKMMAWDPRRPGPGSANLLFVYHNPALGPEFIRQLYSKADLVLSTDQRQMVDWLAQGRYPVGISMGGSVEQARDQGLPVDQLRRALKEGGYMGGQGSLARLRNGPHPNSQRVFVNWLLSREGQMGWQDLVQDNSLREDIPKDTLPEGAVPQPGVNYIFVSLPQYSDSTQAREDIERIVQETLGGR
jgi:ABC-type Fe3+ transport system substrate-binding protein